MTLNLYFKIILLCLFTTNIYAQNIPILENFKKKIIVDSLIKESKELISDLDYEKSKFKLNQVLTIASEINSSEAYFYSNFYLGKIHVLNNKYDLAIPYFNKALNHIDSFKIPYLKVINCFKYLGKAYDKTYNYKAALSNYKQAKKFIHKLRIKDYTIEITLLEAQTLANFNKLDNAEKKLDTVINVSKKQNLIAIESEALHHLSKLLLKKGDTAQAFKMALKSNAIAKKKQLNEIRKDNLLLLIQCYENKKDFTHANKLFKAYQNLSDSLVEAKRHAFINRKNQVFLEQNRKKGHKEANWLEKLTTALSITLVTILSLLALSIYKNANIRLKTNNMLYKKNNKLVLEMKKAELAAKTKTNFLSTVTHELRTPLYAVTGLSDILLEENPKPEQLEHLSALKHSGEYLLTFINDILQINKIEANKTELELEVFDLKKKITNIISSLNNSAVNKNTKIELNYDDKLPLYFNGDQLKFSQILINLLGNAIKFTENGLVKVKVKKVKTENKNYTIRFSVEDNGIGISEKKQKVIFNSFDQGSIEINRKYGGTGLGLSIVKGLIDLLKGSIRLESKLGKGSNFIFKLTFEHVLNPNIKKEVNYIDKIKLSSVKQSKILIVEDNKINQLVTQKALLRMNIKSDVVDNGHDAIKKVRFTDYKLILMDIHMPGISGIETAKEIRKFNKDILIFALTAVTINDHMQDFANADFTGIISKPFKQEVFEKTIYKNLLYGKHKKFTLPKKPEFLS